jgi:hypothetical protein
MFTVYLLHKTKFTQDVLDQYSIYYSQFFRQFVSFSPLVQYWYPKAVERVVEFGDLSLNPQYSKAIKYAKRSR